MTNVLSITAHEAPLCILDQCLNNIVVGEFDYIVVHINALAKIDIQELQKLINQIDLLRGKVLLNPLRLVMPFMLRAQKPHASVLHRAHLSNYLYVKNIADSIDRFCLDSSNSLLVRPGVKAYLAQGEGVNLGELRDTWEWREALATDPFFAIFGASLRIGSHEGSFFKPETFDKICRFAFAYENLLQERGLSDKTIPELPREEFIFPTAYAASRPGEKVLETYIEVRTDTSWSMDEIAAILTFKDKSFSPNRFGLKRVPRDLNDPVRSAVGIFFNYRQVLLEALKR